MEGRVRKSEEYVEKISRTFSAGAVQHSVEKGQAEEAIIVNAAGDKGTLIAMATHGRSRLNHWLLGSVTETVVRHSGDPALVARATRIIVLEQDASMYAKILESCRSRFFLCNGGFTSTTEWCHCLKSMRSRYREW
jgi:hypothetical protein